jgi:hypothetical protein
LSQVTASAYCATCGQQRMFVKSRINHVLHLILSIVTVGLWAIFVWLPLGIINSARGLRCSTCGMKMGSKPAAAAVALDVESHRVPPASGSASHPALDPAAPPTAPHPGPSQSGSGPV